MLEHIPNASIAEGATWGSVRVRRVHRPAVEVSLSPYHFDRLFRQSTDLSPRQYVIERRVEQARRMLLAGPLSVGEVAATVGLADQSHLARHFKRLLGVTPARFAAQDHPHASSE